MKQNRKAWLLFIMLFVVTVLIILLLLHGPQGNNYQSINKGSDHKLSISPLASSSTGMMRPVNKDDQANGALAGILSSMGYNLSDISDQSHFWTDNIELCIMFNLNGIKINKEVLELLVTYYHPFFSHFTLLFNGDPASTKKPDYLPNYVNVLGCDSHVGWYQHRCIRTCIQQGTNETKGFLYIADDMFINISKMAELPSSKVWLIPSGILKYSEILDYAYNRKRFGWVWWGPPTRSAANLEIVINSLPPEWKEQLVKTAGFPNQFKAVATSDIIYVPKTTAPKLEEVLTHIIKTTKLFCEVSTNLAVNIAAPDRVDMENGYLWGDRSIQAMNAAANRAHFVHPVKLGVKEHRDLWIKYMKKQLAIVTERRTNCTVKDK